MAQDTAINRSAFQFVILMGLVSLCADMVYEGARSITGPFLFSLGASAFTVGFVAGLGEFIGYTLRILSGYITDKTKQYWAITIFGYFVNLLAVPLMALAGRFTGGFREVTINPCKMIEEKCRLLPVKFPLWAKSGMVQMLRLHLYFKPV